jgi:hypothetical protein
MQLPALVCQRLISGVARRDCLLNNRPLLTIGGVLSPIVV